MSNQTNSGIKAFNITILAAVTILFLIYLSSSFKEINSTLIGFVLVFLVFIGLMMSHKSVEKVRYTDDKFVITSSSLFDDDAFDFAKEDIDKITFYGKRSRFDGYSITFYFKNGEVKKLDLPFEPKSIFPLIDKLKEKGFLIEYV